MKKHLFIALTLFAIAAITSSCSDDKDSPDTPPVGDEWIDPTFAQVLQERGYITDASKVTPADVADIDKIDVSGEYQNPGNITSLRGIEYFTKLESLFCYYNKILQLDLSKNTELTLLRCYTNQISQLDLTKNTELTDLDCSNNQISQLDLSKNTELRNLSCSNNPISQLDFSKNTKLTSLHCNYNQISRLDISKNTELRNLRCYNNQISQLDITNNTKLKSFDCSGNPGRNNVLEVKAWFDNASIPSYFTVGTWGYNGTTVSIRYINAR